MIKESLCNRVYFSALLPEACPVTYKGLVEVLDRHGVPHSLLEGTRDIWCRDYMPVQMTDHEFVSFDYHPDYLLDTQAHRRSISDGYAVAKPTASITSMTGVTSRSTEATLYIPE